MTGSSLRATLNAIGAYYLSSSVVFTVMAPFRYSLPIFGGLYYEPMITILTVMTAVGAACGAAVAYAWGGVRGFAIVAILQAISAASVIVPLIGQGASWTPPPDLNGVTTPVVLVLSELVALPALLLGFVAGARFIGKRTSPTPALEAAGAYYIVGIAMSLPTPQLDPRLTLPYTASYLTDTWHLAAVAVPAIVAGLLLAARDYPIWKSAALTAAIGLAGVAPDEVSVFAMIPTRYWPVSLAAVPALTAMIAVVVALGKRSLVRRSLGLRRLWLRLTPSSRSTAALVTGAFAAFIGIGAWSVLASMPNPSDRTGPVGSFQRTGDEREIVACVTSGRGEELLGSSAREGPSTVTVRVRLRRPPSWYFHDLAGISLPVVVALRDPLGSRSVIDDGSGHAVPEASRSVGAWC